MGGCHRQVARTLPVPDTYGGAGMKYLCALQPDFYVGFLNRKRIFKVGRRPPSEPVPSTAKSRWRRRAEKRTVKNAIKVAREYEAYLARPEVIGYREVAQHFGVTKATISHYRALLHRLPEEFVSWLEAATDHLVLAFFSQRRLRPITLICHSKQKAALLKEARQLEVELNEESTALDGLFEIIEQTELPAPDQREHRSIQID